ncbi:MAG: CAP domain-containing protein [Polyangiaceae bacterium]
MGSGVPVVRCGLRGAGSCFVAFALAVVGCGSDSDESNGAGTGANGGTSAAGGSATGGSGNGGSGASGAGTGTGASGGAGAATGSGGGTSIPESCDGAPLTQWEQKMLDDHNKWRGSVNPPAANMYRVHWDKAVAQNAANWVASCDPDWPHSPESTRKNVGGYDVLGENLSYCAGTGCAENPGITDGSGMGDGEGWWEERQDYDWATDSSSGVTSHYTQMVSSNVYAIGCATRQCNAPGPGGWNDKWWWTICQYGPRGQAYFQGTKPYDSGSGGLTDPPASVYDQHPALCKSP